MRILAEPNENNQLWRKEVTCTGRGWANEGIKPCGRLLEVLATDVCSRSHTDYCGDTDTYYGFHCPACGCFTELPRDEVPWEVRSMARKR